MTLATFITAVLAAAAEFGLLTLLANLNVSRLSLRFQNSVTTGVVSGAFVWSLLALISLRRKYVRRKLSVVADLNHELRNALEVIMQSQYLAQDVRYVALHDSAERLNRVLMQLLAEVRVTLPNTFKEE